MTYVVTENCIACKYTDCVEVCPVDCFYEGENMLVIHPDECIDCGVCEPECPADAIRPDTEPDTEKWVEFNRKYSEMWPVLVTRRDPLPEAEEMDGKPGKLGAFLRGARRRRLIRRRRIRVPSASVHRSIRDPLKRLRVHAPPSDRADGWTSPGAESLV